VVYIGVKNFDIVFRKSFLEKIARNQLRESQLLERQFLENVLLEGNYHTQDNAVIVITKATSVFHLINLKKNGFTQKF
jgi:hypothetical protein